MTNQKDDKNIIAKKNNKVYILPNLVTTIAMLCGFAAILMALDAYYGSHAGDTTQTFTKASILVFLAMSSQSLL